MTVNEPVNYLDNKAYTTVIREASLFERVSENEMMAQPLSDDTILMDNIIISKFSKNKPSVKEMLKKLGELTKISRNEDSNNSFGSIFDNNDSTDQFNDRSLLLKTMKSLPLKVKQGNRIPYLRVK